MQPLGAHTPSEAAPRVRVAWDALPDVFWTMLKPAFVLDNLHRAAYDARASAPSDYAD